MNLAPDGNRSRLGLLIKSYSGDLLRAQELASSLSRFNVDNLPIWIVVPDPDLQAFEPIALTCKATLLSEELFAQYLTTESIHGIRPGYINQEIVKLAFWELGLVDNYLPVDSDAVILRPFGYQDFMYNESVPFTVLVEDHDLKIDPRYFEDHWSGREESLQKIQEFIGLSDARLLTCHGHQVLSSTVLSSLKTELMQPRGLQYLDLLQISPYEFSWYNFWLQKSHSIPIETREPYFKVIHSSDQHLELALRGITLADISRAYIGVIINSNFSKSWGEIETHETKTTTLARYLSWSELFGTLKTKSKDALKYRLFNRKNPQ